MKSEQKDKPLKGIVTRTRFVTPSVLTQVVKNQDASITIKTELPLTKPKEPSKKKS